MIHQSEIRLTRAIEIVAYPICVFLLSYGVVCAWAFWGR